MLRSFLPSCTYDEAKAFFGPVAAYYAADRSGTKVLAFGWSAKGLTRRELVPEKSSVSAPSEQGTATTAEPARPVTGNLTVTVVDGATQERMRGASVQASGPTTQQAVCSRMGKARFERLEVGEYEIFAIDARQRWGRSVVTVAAGDMSARLTCALPPDLGQSAAG